MDIIQKMRMNRSGSKVQPRKRNLRDLIQLALLYQREGLLSVVEPSNPSFCSRAAEELAVAASISVKGADAILKLVGIRENEDSWTVLKDCQSLGIFEAKNFTGQVGEDENSSSLCLSFLDRFINCEEASIPTQTRSLDYITACFTNGARSRCVTMFLKVASVIGTLSSFFPQQSVVDKFKATDIIERYLSESWTSDDRQRQYHSSANHQHALSGWLIVTEVFKVQVQELLFRKQRLSSRSPESSNDSTLRTIITEDDLKNTAHLFCHQVIVEFFAWVFHFCLGTETVNSFSESICDVIDRVHYKLAREIGCECSEMIPGGLILSILGRMKANAPTMAEIRYDVDEMIPKLRDDKPRRYITWDGREVLMRCRWDHSNVATTYKNFLERCEIIELIPQHDQKQTSSLLGDVHSQLTDTPTNYSPRLSQKRRRPENNDTEGFGPPQKFSRNDNFGTHEPLDNRYDQVSQVQHFDARQRQRPADHMNRAKDLATPRETPYDNPQRFASYYNRSSRPLTPPRGNPRSPQRTDRHNMPFRCSPGGNRGPRPMNPELQRRSPPFCGQDGRYSDSEHRSRDGRPLIPREFSRLDAPEHSNRNERAKKLPNYLNDGEGSDDEGVDNEESEILGGNEYSKRMNETFQKLYGMVLSWPIFQAGREREFFQNGRRRPLTISDRLSTHLLTSMIPWLKAYIGRGKAILSDVTTAKDLSEYCKHWKTLLPLEMRALIQDSVATMLPHCKEGTKTRFQDELPADSFISCVVQESTPSAGLVNMTCVSTEPMINKRIVEELQGGTICVGYISSAEQSTDLILVGCRRVHWEVDDIIYMGAERQIEKIELHLVVSLDRVRDNGVWPKNRICLRQLCHFAPFLRTFKALEETTHLPHSLQTTLFGNTCPAQVADSENAMQLIDKGCATYLEGLQNTSAKVDEPQMDALRTVLSNIGNCGIGSSSFSLIHGPPGTGKTTTILHLIGALVHHSLVGHMGREQINGLKTRIKPDDIERCRESPGGIRILVCAPSNKGVDNILERLDRDGIPDGKGGSFWPETARIARARYDHGTLYKYSLDQKALPFDHHIHNVGANRKNASSKARKSFFRECIVVFTTLVSSGGAAFRNCKVPFDVVIADEIGQASEPDTLIALTNAARRSNRCHFVGVGDHLQLPPIALASHPMKCIGVPIHFDYDKQMVSIFQRIHEHKRAPSRTLSMQYRMCRAVADMNNLNFYGGLLKSCLPETLFNAAYNKGWDPTSGCFARMTFIDTTPLPLRRESSSKDGEYINVDEISIIDEVLHKIKVLAGTNFPQLKGEIAVLVPYRSQVDQLRLVLERTGKYVKKGVSRQGFEILVDSVDSMQGSERDVIIFGTTRSNLDRKIGFLEQANRLNVATSRAKKLQIIIGDMSTLDVNHHFARIRNFCKQESRRDVAFLRLNDSKSSGSMLSGLEELRASE